MGHETKKIGLDQTVSVVMGARMSWEELSLLHLVEQVDKQYNREVLNNSDVCSTSK